MPTRGKRKKYITTREILPIIVKGGYPRTIKKTHQLGQTEVVWDLRKTALEPGKRISKRGNIYYEYRRNRSDKDPRKRI